ncbi:hypothetical protein HDU76_006416 [Blyttiomyces sp. JEL0837]|nr:hypothetical protein HDU76_006416 [Blyttiomyces sp. JEL0837]
MKFKFSWIVLLVVALVVAMVAADDHHQKRKLTQEEIDARAALADREIWHLGPGDFESRIKTGTWLVFFGVRLSPRWLAIQRKYQEQRLIDQDFYMTKVDCTQVDSWCADLKADAYPTLYLYNEGDLIEEYMGDHEVEPIMLYIKEKIAFYHGQREQVKADAAAFEAAAAFESNIEGGSAMHFQVDDDDVPRDEL